MRSRWPWFPMPTLSLYVWFVGLAALVVGLALLAPTVSRGAPGTLVGAWLFNAVMFLNSSGHLAVSLYWHRWLPGATSAPLLLVVSVFLARRTWGRRRRRSAASQEDAP